MSKQIILSRGKGRRVEAGHPWIYGNEVSEISGAPEPGEIVDVFNFKKDFIGKGYYNPASQIVVRLLSRNEKEIINDEFFFNRIRQCKEYRERIGYTENYRLVFGEADFLPALVLDKFGDCFVLQSLSLGIDKWKLQIVNAIKQLYSPKGIYERNDVPVRKLEGLNEQKGFLSEPFPTEIIIDECGVKFNVDLVNGQKTGFFLDQKENRLALKDIVKDASVLDCFSYTGSFSMFAAKFGAKNVSGLDISSQAIQQATANAKLNGFENVCNFESANAFDVMPQWVKERKQFDVIILDPPAFTKNRSGTEAAARGYKEINRRAMQLLKPGGFLLTFSCSHFMSPQLFFETVESAARDSHKIIRQVSYLYQSKDHPIVWSIDETNYLKGFVLQVI